MKPVEVTFTGRGYLSYDMGLDQMTREVLEEEDKTVPEKSIVANRERVEIEFRTNMPEGLIFHTGLIGYMSTACMPKPLINSSAQLFLQQFLLKKSR